MSLDLPREGWQTSLEFWSAASRTTVSAPRGQRGQLVTLEPAKGDSWLTLQAVDENPRLHLDLDSADPVASYERSIGLGALPARADDDVPVARSPGGLLHRHTLARGSRRLARDGADSVLDQVCIDVPAPLWDRDVAYWRALTGRELEQGGEPESPSSAPLIRTDRSGSCSSAWTRPRATSGPTPTSPWPTGRPRPRGTPPWERRWSTSGTGGRCWARRTVSSTASPTATPAPGGSGAEPRLGRPGS